MSKINKNYVLFLVFVFTPIISLFTGFIIDEDLSTGGSKWDFNVTWPLVVDYSNFIFLDARLDGGSSPRHVPLHYFLLSLIYKIFNSQYLVRLFYLFFSLLLPLFLYLNLIKIYKGEKLLFLILSFSFVFLPFFRSSAIWPNAHLTSLIFFTISNYFYLNALDKNRSLDKILNLLFLSFATYSMQTYVIFFAFYLINYLINENKKQFFSLFLFCCVLGIPGLYIIALNEKMVNLPITKDFYYTFVNNFSIIFFFLLFIFFNKSNYKILLNKAQNIKIVEIVILSLLFIFVVYNLDFQYLTPNLKGGGFFYKLSHFIFNNNIIFLSSFFLSLFMVFFLIKEDFKFIYIIILMNIMALNYQTYQKYFEPVFLIMIFILFKSTLLNNIFSKFKNVLFFYLIILFYFFISLINLYYEFSSKMVS